MIVPAKLAFTASGTPYSPDYDDVYHSEGGGLLQARHVFLAGNGLPGRWQHRESFVIVETGFGLGLNFLATWQAWRNDPQCAHRLHYVAVEKHPFSRQDLAVLHGRWPELTALSAELLNHWPPLAAGFHRLHLDQGRVTLTLLFGAGELLLPRLVARCDAIYLDGFAPAKNPELWSDKLIATLSGVARAGATLATWSVAGDVRSALAARGWTLARLPGFGHKREMLSARLAGTFAESKIERRAIVIGAGIAGASCAERLAARGWQVTVCDRQAGAAMEASGNPAGILLPLPAKDDNIVARVSRACYLYTLRALARLPPDSGLTWSACGVVQIARDAAHELLQRETVMRLGLPAEFMTYLGRDQIAALIERPVALGGWHFPGGGWLSPPTLCRALLARGGIRMHFGEEIGAIEQTASGWRVRGRSSNAVMAEAPQLILANAQAALSFAQLMPLRLPLQAVRGQISILPGSTLPGLRQVICRQAYVTPATDEGISCLGATFDSDDDYPGTRLADHQRNLDDLDAMLPGAAQGIDPGRLEGRVGLRSMSPDRLPLAGALPVAADALRSDLTLGELPRLAGLHCLLGYGARGMVWGPLMAELLAARLENEPLPLERELVDSVDPGRFLLRRLRRGK